MQSMEEICIQFARNIRRFVCLAFVPIANVPGVFESLAESLDSDPNYTEFIAYFEKTWIIKYNRTRTVTSDALFPLRIWNAQFALLNESN